MCATRKNLTSTVQLVYFALSLIFCRTISLSAFPLKLFKDRSTSDEQIIENDTMLDPCLRIHSGPLPIVNGSGCNFTDFPTQLKKMINSINGKFILDLSYNSLRTIPQEYWKYLSNVTELYLHNNRYKIFNERWIEYATELRLLDLSRNIIIEWKLTKSTHNKKMKLEELNLSHNKLSVFNMRSLWHNCDSLEELRLNNNNLTSFDNMGSFEKGCALKKVFIMDNPLSCKEINKFTHDMESRLNGVNIVKNQKCAQGQEETPFWSSKDTSVTIIIIIFIASVAIICCKRCKKKPLTMNRVEEDSETRANKDNEEGQQVNGQERSMIAPYKFIKDTIQKIHYNKDNNTVNMSDMQEA